MRLTFDDKFLISLDTNEGLKIWNGLTLKHLRTLPASKNINRFFVSPNGYQVVSLESAIEQHTLKAWDIKTGKLLYSFSRPMKFHTVCFDTKSKQLILSASTSNREISKAHLFFIKNDDGTVMKNLNIGSDVAYSLALSSDGQQLAIGGNDIAFMWDMQTNQKRDSYKLAGTVNAILFNHHDNGLILSTSLSGIKFLDLEQGEFIENNLSLYHLNAQSQLMLSSTTKPWVYINDNRKAMVLDYQTGQSIWTYQEKSNKDTTFAFMNCKSEVGLVNLQTFKFHFYNIPEGKEIKTSEEYAVAVKTGLYPPSKPTEILFSPDGQYIFSAGGNRIQVRETITGKLNDSFPEVPENIIKTSNEIDGFTYLPTQKLFVSTAQSGTIDIWNENGQLIRQISEQPQKINDILDHTVDEKYLLVKFDEEPLKMLDFQTGETVREYQNPFQPIQQMALSKNDRDLAILTENKLIIFDLQTGIVAHQVPFPTSTTTHLMYSHDEKQLIAIDEKQIITFDMFSKKINKTIDLDNKIMATYLTPDSQYLLFVSQNNQDISSLIDVKRMMNDSDALQKEYEKQMVTLRAEFGIINLSTGEIHQQPPIVYKIRQTTTLASLHASPPRIKIARFDEQGKKVILGVHSDWHEEDLFLVWNIKRHQLERELIYKSSEDHTKKLSFSSNFGNINTITVSSKYDRLITSHAFYNQEKKVDTALAIWELHSGKYLRQMVLGTGIEQIIFLNTNEFLTCNRDSTLTHFNIDSGELLNTFVGHTGGCFSALTTSSGKTLISTAQDRILKVWTIPDGKVVYSSVFDEKEEFITWSPEHFFVASDYAKSQYLHVVKGLTIFPIQSFLSQFYKPQFFQGKAL